MANKMLIDASHPEETRVVVLRGSRVEEFDFEAASKKQLRGNIYLAKVMRVEPSLQAAFVDYGGNRHGFLAFSEIHPDYYQIPVADRQVLIEEEARAQRDEEEDVARPQRRSRRYRRGDRNGTRAEKRRSADPTLSETIAEPYAGEAPVYAPGRVRQEAESEGAGHDAPFAAERPAGDRSLDLPEDTAGAPAQDALAQANSASETQPPDLAGETPLVDAAAEPAIVLEADGTGPVAAQDHSETAFAGKGDVPASPARRRLPSPMAQTAKKATKARTKRPRSNSSAAMRWRRCRLARIASAGNIKSKRSSNAAKFSSCKSSRKSAATKERR